jgi:hypothetical protein
VGATDITRVFLVSDCAAGDRRLIKELMKHISNVIVYTLGDSDAAKSFIKMVRPPSPVLLVHAHLYKLCVVLDS